MAKKKLAKVDWERVLKLRCRSKRGGRLSEEESAYCRAAWEADEERYSLVEKEVFEATKPFGAR